MKTDRSITPSEKLPIARPRQAAFPSVARWHALMVNCALLFGAALLIRLFRLGAQSLWLDEGGTWAEVTGKGWPALLAELWGRNAAYPLYHILLKGWVGLAGDSEWALRLPSALAGAAAVVAIYLAANDQRPTTNDQRPTRTEDRGLRTEDRSREQNQDELRTTDNGQRTAHATRNTQHATRNTQRFLPFTFYLLPSTLYPLIAALLFAVSPFALWYAQDAKVYSLLMLVVALELWALLRALRRGGRAWLLVLATVIVSVFVHRLALLAAAGAALAYLIIWPPAQNQRPTTNDQRPTTQGTENSKSRIPNSERDTTRNTQRLARVAFALLTAAIAAAGVAGIAAGFSGESRGSGGHIPAGPLQGLWLSFAHFSADRGDVNGWLGLPLVVWMLPCIVLTIWGLALLLRDAARRDAAAIAILCMFAVPLALLAAALAITPVYEARYATIAFPAWVLILAYPFARPTTNDHRPSTNDERGPSRAYPADVVGVQHSIRNTQHGARFSVLSSRLAHNALFFVLCSLFLVNVVVLFQPKHGLFSGAPVKEQWRQAIDDLAHQAHPDDLVILHPYFVKPLWDYYAPRVTPDPLPQPVTFPVFAGGFCLEQYQDPHQVQECVRRKYNEPYFNEQAYGKKRALLLIAPDHANIVDPPLNPPLDKYGFVGLRFQYAAEERAWPCGGSGDMYIGVEVMCQSFPETYNSSGAGTTPQPATPLAATFGDELRLRGYSLDLLGGSARPGGTLPVTLYWEAAAPPTHDYTMFLHLCRDCAIQPLAQNDGPPLSGYPPAGRTTQWIVGDPVHDERAITLPADLPAGRYTLLLGAYPAGDPSEEARLPVASDAPVLGGTRLVLGEVEIKP